MEKVIYDEKNGLWYELQGDYYIPCLKLPEEEQQPIGVWGQRYLRYIKQNSNPYRPHNDYNCCYLGGNFQRSAFSWYGRCALYRSFPYRYQRTP